MAQSDEPRVLSDAQLARLRTVGQPRRYHRGDVLVAAGERDYPFLLVDDGSAEVVRGRTPGRPEVVLRRWRAGEFAREWGLITGQLAFLTIRASEPALVHEIARQRFLEILSQEAELSDVIMQELLRRREVLRTGEGATSVEILGAAASPAAHALRSWAQRQRIVFTWLDIDDPATSDTAPHAPVPTEPQARRPAVWSVRIVRRRWSRGRVACLAMTHVSGSHLAELNRPSAGFTPPASGHRRSDRSPGPCRALGGARRGA
jgi:CRP-like cAMP-binding protein